jgi:hypothetical protein
MALTKKKKGGKGKENRRAPVKGKVPNRPKKHRQWSEESMLGAMNAVKEGLMGVNRAAFEFAVPRTTLKDRISGRVIHGTSTGPKPYLSLEEEKELVDFLLKCSRMGYGKTRGQVMKIVEATMKKKGMKDCCISPGWWATFCKRWPKLSLRKGDSFSIAREKMTTRGTFESYFNMLKETLENYDLTDKPAQIYNCDESGMPLEHKLPKTISLKGTKKVRQITSGNKAQITVLGCASATGQIIPPMVVFSGKRFNHELSKGEVPGTLYGMSDSGWMDSELFSNWFSNHFLKHAVSSRPLMLILDGHSSHYTLELVNTAAEHDVIIFCLPPHTTADSQPLDTSCFGPLKTYWGKVCQEFMFTNPGRAITKFQFSKLFAEAWSEGMSISNICSGFRCTGIYPFNPEVILKKLPKDDDSDVNTVQPKPSKVVEYSPEELECFETRFDNGYDIFTDERYLTWLRQYHPDSTPQGDVSLGSTLNNESRSDDDQPENGTFSSEELERFETRYENGYDIFTDERYVAWLHKYHPNSAPSISSLFASVTPLDSGHETGIVALNA